MKCGIIDIGCAIHKVIDPLWFWIYWGFWGIVALVALGVLYRIKQVFGWRGVEAAVIAAAGVIIAIFSFKKGRESMTPVEGDFDPPLRPKKPRKPHKAGPIEENRPGTWNPRTGSWN